MSTRENIRLIARTPYFIVDFFKQKKQKQFILKAPRDDKMS